MIRSTFLAALFLASQAIGFNGPLCAQEAPASNLNVQGHSLRIAKVAQQVDDEEFSAAFEEAYEGITSLTPPESEALPPASEQKDFSSLPPLTESPNKNTNIEIETPSTQETGQFRSLPREDGQTFLPSHETGTGPLAEQASRPSMSGTSNDFVPTNSGTLYPMRTVQPMGTLQQVDPYETPLWWKNQVGFPLHQENAVVQTDTNALLYAALKNSPRIQSISKDPLIRDVQVVESLAEFDPSLYMRTQFDDRVDPVGNTLTTGGDPFLEDHIWSGESGIRKKLPAGGSIDFGQRIGFQNSNSRFFVPQDQGTATLALNFTQPLLRGRGRYYNQSQILIAQSTGGVAWEVFQAQLQDELESVVKSYWRLYYERSTFLQKRRNVIRGQKILDLLEGREGLDTLPSQLARARSAVLSRKTELANAFRDVRNSETELRRVIADPDWLANQSIEMLPIEPAARTPFDMELSTVVYAALENRPEIREAFNKSKIAAVQYDVSTNELLPDLTLLLGTYVSALEGDSGIERALQSQFSSTPGYTVGLEFDYPIHNRAARSRVAQRQLQKAKIAADIKDVMQNIIAESQVSHRQLATAHQTLDAALVAIEAARADLMQNENRWESFALVEGDIAEGQTPTTILDQLLDSQERLAGAELVFAQAELELKISEIRLRRTMGTLLQYERVMLNKYTEGDVPGLSLDRVESVQPVEMPMMQPTTAQPQFPDNAVMVHPSEGSYPLDSVDSTNRN